MRNPATNLRAGCDARIANALSAIATCRAMGNSVAPTFSDDGRGLGNRFPEVWVMAVKNAGTARAHGRKRLEGRAVQFGVVAMIGKPQLVQRPAQVAAIGGKNDLAPFRPDPRRLMARCMPRRRKEHYRTVAEHVVFAAHHLERLTSIEFSKIVGLVTAVECIVVLVRLHDYGSVRQIAVSTSVVGMKMGAQDPADRIGIDPDAPQMNVDGGIILKVYHAALRRTLGPDETRTQPGIEQGQAAGMVDQVGGGREGDLAVLTCEKKGKAQCHPAHGKGEKANTNASEPRL
jgi:hypothetical protein